MTPIGQCSPKFVNFEPKWDRWKTDHFKALNWVYKVAKGQIWWAPYQKQLYQIMTWQISYFYLKRS